MQEPSSLKRTGYLRLQEKKLSRAIATAPDDVEGWMQYGYVLLEQDQHKEVSPLCSLLFCLVAGLMESACRFIDNMFTRPCFHTYVPQALVKLTEAGRLGGDTSRLWRSKC